MSLDLSKFKVDEKASGAWEWATIVPAWRGTILAFDQTLSATGWVMVNCYGEAIVPMYVGMFGAKDVKRKGNPGNLEKADQIFDQAYALIGQHKPDAVAHEAPGSGGRLSRPESSMMAAEAIRNVCKVLGVRVLEMVDPRSAKKRFTGNANADKSVVHTRLLMEYPTLSAKKPNNENTRDAMVVACVAAERETNARST